MFRQDSLDARLLRPNEESVELESGLWATQGLVEVVSGLFAYQAEPFQYGYLSVAPIRVKEVG